MRYTYVFFFSLSGVLFWEIDKIGYTRVVSEQNRLPFFSRRGALTQLASCVWDFPCWVEVIEVVGPKLFISHGGSLCCSGCITVVAVGNLPVVWKILGQRFSVLCWGEMSVSVSPRVKWWCFSLLLLHPLGRYDGYTDYHLFCFVRWWDNSIRVIS